MRTTRRAAGALERTPKAARADEAAFLAIDHGETVAWHTLESLTAIVRRHRPDEVNGRRKIASIKSPPAESTFSAVSDDMSTLAGGRC